MWALWIWRKHDKVNRESLWHLLRMYVNSLTCVRVKGGESICFRIDSGERHRAVHNAQLEIVGPLHVDD